MKHGDEVTHKNKKYSERGIGVVSFTSSSGLVFVQWPNAKVRTYPAYYKASSLIKREVSI